MIETLRNALTEWAAARKATLEYHLTFEETKKGREVRQDLEFLKMLDRLAHAETALYRHALAAPTPLPQP